MCQISVFLHILIAMFWIGGMLFTAAILVPATRKKLANRRGELFTELDTRFSRLTWILFPFLILIEILSLPGQGYQLRHLITSDLWVAPKASRLMHSQPKTDYTQKIRLISSWTGRVNLLLGLIIVYFAVSLVR